MRLGRYGEMPKKHYLCTKFRKPKKIDNNLQHINENFVQLVKGLD